MPDKVTSPAQRGAKNFAAEHPGGDFNAFVKSTATNPAAQAKRRLMKAKKLDFMGRKISCAPVPSLS